MTEQGTWTEPVTLSLALAWTEENGVPGTALLIDSFGFPVTRARSRGGRLILGSRPVTETGLALAQAEILVSAGFGGLVLAFGDERDGCREIRALSWLGDPCGDGKSYLVLQERPR